MTVYNDALWAEATFDHEAAHDAEIMGAAQVAGAEVWSVLASAESSEDFHTRLALMEPRIHAVAASIATEGSPDYTRIIAALPARFFEDWTLLAEARRREVQVVNARRAAARAAAREARRSIQMVAVERVADGWCCTDCLMLIANGDTSGFSGTDEEKAAWLAEVDRRSEGINWVPGDDEMEFSSIQCDVCGTRLAGYRHEVIGLGTTASKKTAANCACAHNTDGSTTTMLCPVHADEDPCYTKALVTGRRREGTIRNGTCTNCGWTTKNPKTASPDPMLPGIGPKDPGFGSIYGGSSPAYTTTDGTPVWMWRKGQTVRFYDADGNQVGPEQSNVAPAVAYAQSQGWNDHIDIHWTAKVAYDTHCPYCGQEGCSPNCPGPSSTGVCPKCGGGMSNGKCNDPQGCGYGWDGDRGLTSDGEPRFSSLFATAAESAEWMTPEGAPEARPMEEAVKDPALDETDPVRWKQSAAEEKVCETCSHPLWWNEERGEYVHRGEYGDQGHKPNPVSKQSARWPWQRTADVWGVQPDGAVYDPRKKAAAPPSNLYELAKARWGGAQAKDYQGGKGFMADGYLYVFTKPNRGPYSSTPADVEWCMEANDGAGVDFRRTADGGWEYHGLTEVINNEGWKKLGSNRLASDGWKKLAYGDEHILSQEEKEGLREVKWGTLKPGDRFINLGMGTKTMVGNDGRVQFLYGVEHGGTVWTVKSVNEDGTITAVNHLGKEQTGAPPNPSTQTVTKMAARKQAVGDNSWPPKEGGEKEGGDPKAPPAAPGAPQAPVPTATEQAQPGQPGTPASGITVGTVLLDHVDGIISTYEVSNVVDEGETVLVSVIKNGGEQMDLRIPKTETVQTYQAKGDDATAPVEQPEGAPGANPFADKAAADGEEAKPEGDDKPEGEEKPKDDEDDPDKKKGNPFAKGSARKVAYDSIPKAEWERRRSGNGRLEVPANGSRRQIPEGSAVRIYGMPEFSGQRGTVLFGPYISPVEVMFGGGAKTDGVYDVEWGGQVHRVAAGQVVTEAEFQSAWHVYNGDRIVAGGPSISKERAEEIARDGLDVGGPYGTLTVRQG